VVEGLDRFSPCQWVENEAGALAPVLDLDAEFVLEVAAVPKQVDDDSVGVAVSEVICRGQHFPPPICSGVVACSITSASTRKSANIFPASTTVVVPTVSRIRLTNPPTI